MTTDQYPSTQTALLALAETAWRYRSDEIRSKELPMTAAHALAEGLDSPALFELAGLPRNADTDEIRDLFERALDELGIELPTSVLAYRYRLRRLALQLLNEEIAPTELAASGQWEIEVETVQERALLALIPACSCCLEYTMPRTTRHEWAAHLRAAALALTSAASVGPER